MQNKTVVSEENARGVFYIIPGNLKGQISLTRRNSYGSLIVIDVLRSCFYKIWPGGSGDFKRLRLFCLFYGCTPGGFIGENMPPCLAVKFQNLNRAFLKMCSRSRGQPWREFLIREDQNDCVYKNCRFSRTQKSREVVIRD